MKYVNVKLLTMMTSVIFMMTAGPAAFGQATPEVHAPDLFPFGLKAPNTLFQWASKNVAANTGDGSEFLDIISKFVFVYFSPSGAFTVNAGNYPACIATLPSNPGDMLWVLYHSTNAAKTTVTPVTSSHIDVGVNSPSTIFFDSLPTNTPVPGILPQNPNAVAGDGFGGGDPATTRSAANGGTTGAILSPPLANAGEFYYWQKIDSAGNEIVGAGNTGSPGEYTFVMCAFIDVFVGDPLLHIGNGVFDITTDGQNNVFASVNIESTVGGVQIPTSATSLLVAGAEANALWILSILGLAGTIIAIRKLEA